MEPAPDASVSSTSGKAIEESKDASSPEHAGGEKKVPEMHDVVSASPEQKEADRKERDVQAIIPKGEPSITNAESGPTAEELKGKTLEETNGKTSEESKGKAADISADGDVKSNSAPVVKVKQEPVDPPAPMECDQLIRTDMTAEKTAEKSGNSKGDVIGESADKPTNDKACEIDRTVEETKIVSVQSEPEQPTKERISVDSVEVKPEVQKDSATESPIKEEPIVHAENDIPRRVETPSDDVAPVAPKKEGDLSPSKLIAAKDDEKDEPTVTANDPNRVEGHLGNSKDVDAKSDVVLQSVKSETPANETHTVVKSEPKTDDYVAMDHQAENIVKVATEPSATVESTDKMETDETNPPAETVPKVAGAEVAVEHSKAVHEIIAEQSRGDVDSTVPTSVASEKVDAPPTIEVSKPSDPDQKEEQKELTDDWDIPASDEEEENGEPLEGEPGEKKKKVSVKRGYWEPPVEVIVELYRKLDQEGILELTWKCPGRRPPSEEGDKEEEKELMEDVEDEEKMEISKEEIPTEFDFDMDVDSTAKTVTPRRVLGSGQAQGSGKKRVARMDKVLNDIFRHRKIESTIADQGETKREDEVAMETDQTGDGSSSSPANVTTPNRPQGKVHIRSDLDM
ncbi:uncharacterized protein [Diadema setosum]|uniref:uncharacterized protein n=1 Tax=Diadema setosum TaxID=31175 RepID=UPI003B3A41D4